MSGSAPVRPPFLGQYLDIAKEQSSAFSEKYSAFLVSAKTAQQDMDQAGVLSIEVSGKVNAGSSEAASPGSKRQLHHNAEGILEFTYPRTVIRARFQLPISFTSFKRTAGNDKLIVSLTKWLNGRLG